MVAMLETSICGLKMKNPLVLASGIRGNSADLLIRAASEGAGAVTSKSCSLLPREGHSNPTMVESISVIARSQQEKRETPVAPTTTTPSRVSVKSPLIPQGQRGTGKGTRPEGERVGAKGKHKGVNEKTKHKDEDDKESVKKVSESAHKKRKIATREEKKQMRREQDEKDSSQQNETNPH